MSPEDSWVLQNEGSSTDSNEWSSNGQESDEHPSRSSYAGPPSKFKSASRQPRSNRQRLDLSSTKRHTPTTIQDIPIKAEQQEFIMPSMIESSPGSWRSQPAQPAGTPSKLRRRPGKTQTTKITRTQGEGDESRWQTVQLLAREIIVPIVSYVSSTVSLILRFLKPFLAYGIGFWILAYLSSMLISSTVSRTLGPICKIPGISWLGIPFCEVAQSHGPVEFDQLMTVQSAFEDVLSSTAHGAALPVEMKRSESSIRDLKHVVQFSTLPSRHELVFEITGFIETARMASTDLTKFNSRIGRAVDYVLNTNHWTLQVLDSVAGREVARGSVSRFLHGTVLAPFRSVRVAEDLLLEQYLRHAQEIEEQIQQLILEAQALLAVLENLDNRLDVIQGITMRDGMKVQGSKAELLSQLWSKLGGNRSSRKQHDEQLRLLKQVGVYRKTAWDHVSATIIKLQSIAAGLEDLRERVAAPDVLRRYDDIPLRMHIEHIQMGVQRLEDQRLESRKTESENYRKVLDKGALDEDKTRFIEGGKRTVD